ncbi:helix-turn-helix domain-containing protein [Nocardia terpenica]|uniref:Uncharacterized protein n=1 Tax=Nocardia terpenica TaxID=455432 RepID=A0A164LC00_9NOCA|nr:helix-turn-helix domain-containing protein [Nocardia terpenica]KZM72240.1 hypothetical protein AWN90_36815 [Nocardia terpenica]NQE86614.1 helix-turn-helix domain-containing protein [Nocardia terpenica]
MPVYVWLRPEFEGRESELMLLADVAKELGVSPQAVTNWRRRHPRQFPPTVAMVGRLVYVARAEVIDFAASRGLPQPDVVPPQNPSTVWHRPEFMDRPHLLVNLAEVAAQFGVSRQAVSWWRQRGDDFPAAVFESARQVLVVRTEIEDWVRARNLARAERAHARRVQASRERARRRLSDAVLTPGTAA